MSLFPTPTTRTELPLVQFNAGKCNLTSQNDGSFLVTPDLRKGKISLHKGPDGLIHFKWTERSSNTLLMDLIVFSDEVIFKKVRTGTPTDRVYMLKWKIGDRREMFWLQDKRTDNDTDNCEKLNRFINNPDATNQPTEPNNLVRMLRRPPVAAAAAPARPAAPQAGRHSNAFGLDLGRIIQGIQAPASSPPAVATAPTQAPVAAPAPAPPVTTNSSNNQPFLSADALRNAMAGMTLPPAGQPVQRQPPTDINRVLSPDAIIATGILNDPEVRRSLIALLPESQQNDESLEENLRSPQLQQALDALAGALQSENYPTVMSNLGLDPNEGMSHILRGDAIGAFLAAAAARGAQLRQQNESSTSGSSGGEGGGGEEKKSDSNDNNDDMDQYYS